ncbi:hypothetical protein [Paenibacillus dendritiformis]|uniref:hypothetical protein n=1 Tax=Paenibacillus dendritiformis TaxID=130049 RepID=UPI0018CD60CD|nr:hypothetical protein [Paenibacillus dendritiformis]
MEVLLERCAGMDVHQETIVVCVMTTDSAGEVQSEVRTFGTLTKHLFELLKYLESREVTHIAMERMYLGAKQMFVMRSGSPSCFV